MVAWEDVSLTIVLALHAGCYPFQDKDQFVIEECPHVFFVGNQPRFETSTIEGPAGQQVRIIAIPKFHETGQIVLLDTESLEAELVEFDVNDETEKDKDETR